MICEKCGIETEGYYCDYCGNWFCADCLGHHNCKDYLIGDERYTGVENNNDKWSF